MAIQVQRHAQRTHRAGSRREKPAPDCRRSASMSAWARSRRRGRTSKSFSPAFMAPRQRPGAARRGVLVVGVRLPGRRTGARAPARRGARGIRDGPRRDGVRRPRPSRAGGPRDRRGPGRRLRHLGAAPRALSPTDRARRSERCRRGARPSASRRCSVRADPALRRRGTTRTELRESTWHKWVTERWSTTRKHLVSGWRPKIAADPELDRLFRACEQRCTGYSMLARNGDLVHGDLPFVLVGHSGACRNRSQPDPPKFGAGHVFNPRH